MFIPKFTEIDWAEKNKLETIMNQLRNVVSCIFR